MKIPYNYTAKYIPWKELKRNERLRQIVIVQEEDEICKILTEYSRNEWGLRRQMYGFK